MTSHATPWGAIRLFAGLALTAIQGMTGPLGGTALAEERDPFAPRPPLPLLRNDVAGTRQIPGYTASGVRLGAFTVHAQATLRAEGDSNVLNRRADKRADLSGQIGAGFTAHADLGTGWVGLDASGTTTRYARLTGQNHETFAVEAKGAVPLGTALQLGLGLTWSRKREPNYTVGAADGDSPTLYGQLGATLGLSAGLGPSRVAAQLDLDRFDYLPVVRSGVRIDQSYRDQRVLTARLRAEHALPAGRTLFLQGTYRWGNSLHPAPCCDRTARGGEIVAGLRGEVTHLISAELAAGYQWRDYRSLVLRDFRGAALRARVEWYATPLVSLALSARRDIVDSGLPTSAGVVVDSARVQLFYELKRNLNLVATAALAREKYRDDAAVNLVSRTASAGLEARLALSNRYLVGAYARTRNRTSDSTLLPAQGAAVEGGLSLRLTL